MSDSKADRSWRIDRTVSLSALVAVVIWLFSLTVGAVTWKTVVDGRLDALTTAAAPVPAHSERILKLETEQVLRGQQLDRIESKLDDALRNRSRQ